MNKIYQSAYKRASNIVNTNNDYCSYEQFSPQRIKQLKRIMHFIRLKEHIYVIERNYWETIVRLDAVLAGKYGDNQ